MDISVLLLTYNHEPYVGEAVDSVCAQDFEGSWELVIADDCSVDGTLSVIADRAENMPRGAGVRVLSSEVNLGMQANLRRGIEACSGRLVALLEGDDLWTCAQKLRMQHAVLHGDPSLSASAHHTSVLSLDASGQWSPSDGTAARVAAGQLDLVDVLMGRSPHASSLVFRSDLLPSTPTWFDTIQMADWPMAALLATRGPIAVDGALMSAYRKGVGMHSTQSRAVRWERTVECCEAIVHNMPMPDGLADLALSRAFGMDALSLVLARRPAPAAYAVWRWSMHLVRYGVASVWRSAAGLYGQSR